jgi:hypothetical protein
MVVWLTFLYESDESGSSRPVSDSETGLLLLVIPGRTGPAFIVEGRQAHSFRDLFRLLK